MDAFLVRLATALFDGFWVTLFLLVTSGIAGNLAAIGVALARTSRRIWLSAPATGFILAIRGTPLIVQMFLIYYGLGQFRAVRASILWPILRDPTWCAFLALTISTAAYSGEVIRGAIQQVPAGQVQAGEALGLSRWQIRRLVVLPLALRQVVPVLANETVLLLKASAIVFTITVKDIMGEANIIRAQTFRVYEPLLAAAILYLALTFAIRRLFAIVEKRSRRHLDPPAATAKGAVPAG
ncbi:ABC transporter permease [Oharaeibacter diazotrophicus]|uniref:Amino acid ABC transporter membrane protein 2 (PAAT family) n=1 Tax=Oharaeibacter diazotrophicus TaxID=1920512 RepID=A0A4R6R9W1_9HYPH|nr:ABC transporter permease subunit [Oharaeibacter diazotrophicus]TDP82789.1 amino acid ABC transporter membrane protein 2 (PAAT family) [Oharaeibacter diazotrophicus]BBE72449.1 octopine transport system permease protein OccM [Pleomorphomonas sp. SM30]GLS76480.1 amino acid ABC transporter permease [Oharaeibacter diazotrophicus]